MTASAAAQTVTRVMSLQWQEGRFLSEVLFIQYGGPHRPVAPGRSPVRARLDWWIGHVCSGPVPNRPFWAEHEDMGESPPTLQRATERDHNVIVRLIDAAAEWLRTKNTDQWAQPWPSVEDRNHRILRDLQAGKTWIAWDEGVPAATITADPADS